MDGFVKAEKSNMTMGYFNPKLIPYYWDYASQYVLMDNYFTSALTPASAASACLVETLRPSFAIWLRASPSAFKAR